MTFAQSERVALSQASKAILLRELNVGTVTSITVVPTEHFLGRVEYSLLDVVPTVTSLKNRLVAHLSDLYGAVLGCEDYLGDDNTWRIARQLSEQVADLENPLWRDNQGYLSTYILQSCMLKASTLVQNHEARIRGLAALLVDKGELKGADLVAFF